MPRVKSNRARYPRGKLKPEVDAPTLVRRMIDQARSGASNPLLGSELGRLRLNGVLDDRQVSAGQKFGDLVGRHDRIKGMPERGPKSASWQRGAGSGDRPEPDQSTIDDVLRRYSIALAVLSAEGRAVKEVTFGVTVYDDCAPSFDQPYLIRGLDRLVIHFGLDGSRPLRQPVGERGTGQRDVARYRLHTAKPSA